MRDLAILEEWLVKVREEKRAYLQKTLIGATNDMHLAHAQNIAFVVEIIGNMIESVRLLDKDAGEFVKRNLS